LRNADNVQSELGICRNTLDVVLADTNRDRAFFYRTMRLIRSVNTKRGKSRPLKPNFRVFEAACSRAAASACIVEIEAVS
jgi:hypothetical protein